MHGNRAKLKCMRRYVSRVMIESNDIRAYATLNLQNAGPIWFGTLCFDYTKMAPCNVYVCWGTFKREYLAHLLRLGELVLSFAIGTMTLISYGTQFWVETADYHQGLWINCSTKPNVPCETLPLVVEHGKSSRARVRTARACFLQQVAKEGECARFILYVGAARECMRRTYVYCRRVYMRLYIT